MDDRQLAAAVDASYFAAFRDLALQIGMPVHEAGGLLCVSTGAAGPELNIAFVTRALDDAPSRIRQAIDFFAGHGIDFHLCIREQIDVAAAHAALDLGLTTMDTVPGMAMQPIAATPPPLIGLRIERVGNASQLEDFVRVMAAGFGMPVEAVRRMAPTAALSMPGVAYFIAYVDGEPVSTSALVRTENTAGIYNVATLASHRRRGLGEAMTWHAIGEGQAEGCVLSVLQSSPMGRAIYERMGFRVVATYRTFQRGTQA